MIFSGVTILQGRFAFPIFLLIFAWACDFIHPELLQCTSWEVSVMASQVQRSVADDSN